MADDASVFDDADVTTKAPRAPLNLGICILAAPGSCGVACSYIAFSKRTLTGFLAGNSYQILVTDPDGVVRPFTE